MRFLGTSALRFAGWFLDKLGALTLRFFLLSFLSLALILV
jgi:hypothetical protein